MTDVHMECHHCVVLEAASIGPRPFLDMSPAYRVHPKRHYIVKWKLEGSHSRDWPIQER